MKGPRTIHVECPICGEQVPVQLVARVNVDADAALVRELVAGRLNRATCAVCGHSGALPEPVIVSAPTRGFVAGYIPAEVPPNRKAGIGERLLKNAERIARPKGKAAACFGPAQLRRALPELDWPRELPSILHRFDDPGAARHQEQAARRALKARPDDPALLARLGIALYNGGRTAQARAPLERAVALEPGMADALHALASVNLDDGSPEEAMRLYDRVVSISHAPLARFLAGVAAHRAGRPKDALDRLQQAVREEPGLVEAHVWLAIVHLASGSRGRALASLRQAAASGMSDPRLVLDHEEFGPLQSDSEFREIIAAVGKRHERTPRTGRRDRRVRHRG